MLMLALPLTGLYFLGVALCVLWPRGQRRLEAPQQV
jgi:Sec-independent protein secretion pathway component TatC